MAFCLWTNLLTLGSLAPATRARAFFLSAASQSSDDWDLNTPVHCPNLSLLPLGLDLLDKVQFLSKLYRRFLSCGPCPTLFHCKPFTLRQGNATTEILDFLQLPSNMSCYFHSHVLVPMPVLLPRRVFLPFASFVLIYLIRLSTNACFPA